MLDTTLIPAGNTGDLPPGARRIVFVTGAESILIFNVNGQFHALENSCPHAGASIANGACEGHVVSCPAHGLKFNITNGQCTASPQLRIRTHEVVVQGERLWLRLQTDAPAPAGNHLFSSSTLSSTD